MRDVRKLQEEHPEDLVRGPNPFSACLAALPSPPSELLPSDVDGVLARVDVEA